VLNTKERRWGVMSVALESVVQELKVLIDEVVEKVGKVRKIAHEMYFMRGLVDEVYEKVKEARDKVIVVERMVEESRYGER
jgi:UDP-2,3-diacylglucosamine pyrophosphatase LpxH